MDTGNAILLSTLIVAAVALLTTLIWQRRTGKHELTEEQSKLLDALTEKVSKLEVAEKECQAERKKQTEVEERLRRELIEKEKISYALISENYALLKQLAALENAKRP